LSGGILYLKVEVGSGRVAGISTEGYYFSPLYQFALLHPGRLVLQVEVLGEQTVAMIDYDGVTLINVSGILSALPRILLYPHHTPRCDRADGRPLRHSEIVGVGIKTIVGECPVGSLYHSVTITRGIGEFNPQSIFARRVNNTRSGSALSL
jgi:hypothetical protein